MNGGLCNSYATEALIESHPPRSTNFSETRRRRVVKDTRFFTQFIHFILSRVYASTLCAIFLVRSDASDVANVGRRGFPLPKDYFRRRFGERARSSGVVRRVGCVDRLCSPSEPSNDRANREVLSSALCAPLESLSWNLA